MKIVMVGTTVNLSENEERDMRQYIAIVLKRYDAENDTIISGGAKGVGFLVRARSVTAKSWAAFGQGRAAH